VLLKEKTILAALPPHRCVVALYNTFQVRKKVNRSYTHTPTENNTPDTDTHAHDKNNTPNPQTNTSHTHLTALEGGSRYVMDIHNQPLLLSLLL